MAEPRELFPIVDLRHDSIFVGKDFRPLIEVEDPTDVELAILEEQQRVAEELGMEATDEVNVTPLRAEGEPPAPTRGRASN